MLERTYEAERHHLDRPIGETTHLRENGSNLSLAGEVQFEDVQVYDLVCDVRPITQEKAKKLHHVRVGRFGQGLELRDGEVRRFLDRNELRPCGALEPAEDHSDPATCNISNPLVSVDRVRSDVDCWQGCYMCNIPATVRSGLL